MWEDAPDSARSPSLQRRTNMTLTRWKPINDIVGLNDLDQIFEAFRPSNPAVAGRGLVPALDLKETPREFTLQMDLPGFKKDDVKITFEDQVLTLSGERKSETREENERHHHIERSYGRFARRVQISAPVNADQVKARFEDGVLTVVLPKSEEAQPRSIEIG
jgi:HSP20 family protein